MPEIVFLNGKFIPKEDAEVSALEPGFLYGWGLFETMRSYNGRIVYFGQHLERIKNSCQLIAIKFPYPTIKLKEIIKKTVEINGFEDSYVKLIISKSERGAEVLVIVKRYAPYPQKKYRLGLRACIAGFRQNELSIFARLKTNNRLLYQLACSQAKNKDFDEAVILNNRGYITEGSRSNIFLVEDNEIFTPSLECGCLDGITRRVVFDLAKKHSLKIYEGNFTVQDLYQADEAFLTNSLMGVMPLASVEHRRIGTGINKYKLTGLFMKKYNLLLLKKGT